jgi:hypothetical protein
MTSNPTNTQARFFEMIQRNIPSSISLVDHMMEILKMSDTSVYRRMRGEISLTMDEIILLCNLFNISFDSMLNLKGNTVNFGFNLMTSETDLRNYFLAIAHDMEVLSRNKTGKAIYAAEDIPIFHNFGFPDLAKFKIFYLLKSVINIEALQGVKYNNELVSEEVSDAGRQLYDAYAKIPSIEIWTEMTPVSLFKQIEFSWESGLFESKEVALAICDAAKDMFDLLKKSATLGCKFDSQQRMVGGGQHYQLYSSDIEIGNNCILTDFEGDKTAYLAFNTFNKLTTRDRSFCDEIHRWQNNLIGKSNPLSTVSEKKRNQFFQSINDGLENTRKKITG